jgi:hypothetical protein
MRRTRRPILLQHSQAGGITILVVLLLLVLLTVTAFGLSRNSIRENIISGTARQGMVVRNVADAGLEWAVFWLDDANVADSTTPGATALQAKANNLLINPSLTGTYQAIAAGTNADMFVQNVAGQDDEHFDMRLMSMGKLPVLMTSQNVIASNTPSEALFPDLWAVRADAHYVQGGVVDFIHGKEAWVSTKARTVN